MVTIHNNIRKILVTDAEGHFEEYAVPAGSTVTLEPVESKGAVFIDFDTDDDFALRLNGNTFYYDTLYFCSVDEAIKALQSIEVVNAREWTQSGTTIAQRITPHPAEHWYYEWIYEAIAALQNGETSFVRSGNQTLQVSVY